MTGEPLLSETKAITPPPLPESSGQGVGLGSGVSLGGRGTGVEVGAIAGGWVGSVEVRAFEGAVPSSGERPHPDNAIDRKRSMGKMIFFLAIIMDVL